MSISQADLEKIAQLAYLDVEEDNSSQLCQEVSSIMDFVEQLRSVNTSGIAPLFHPLALSQRCRTDVITEEDCTKELANIAPLFEDNLYLVPKVIEGGK